MLNQTIEYNQWLQKEITLTRQEDEAITWVSNVWKINILINFAKKFKARVIKDAWWVWEEAIKRIQLIQTRTWQILKNSIVEESRNLKIKEKKGIESFKKKVRTIDVW